MITRRDYYTATIEISSDSEPSLSLGTTLITRVRRLMLVLLIKQILSLERLPLEQVIKLIPSLRKLPLEMPQEPSYKTNPELKKAASRTSYERNPGPRKASSRTASRTLTLMVYTPHTDNVTFYDYIY